MLSFSLFDKLVNEVSPFYRGETCLHFDNILLQVVRQEEQFLVEPLGVG